MRVPASRPAAPRAPAGLPLGAAPRGLAPSHAPAGLAPAERHTLVTKAHNRYPDPPDPRPPTPDTRHHSSPPMPAFTNPSGALVRSTAFINELIDAYNERRLAVDPTDTDALLAFAAGDLWRQVSPQADPRLDTEWHIDTLQARMEALCTSYVYDAQAGVAGHFNGVLEPDLPMYDLATWRADAGLNASGFTRTRDGVVVGYGLYQAGDNITNQLWSELQAGLDSMRWTTKTHTTDGWDEPHIQQKARLSTGGCAAARALQIAAWDAVFLNVVNAGPYEAWGGRTVGSGSDTFFAWRVSSRPTASGLYDAIAHVADAYGVNWIAPSVWSFVDTDAIGLLGTDLELFRVEEFASAATDHRLGDWFNGLLTNPVEIIPIDCSSTVDLAYGVIFYPRSLWVLKWAFTHTL